MRRQDAEADARRAPEGCGPGWARVNAKVGCRSRRPQDARRVRAQDGPASMLANPLLLLKASGQLLFDLGGLLQAFDVVGEFLLHDAVGKLSLHLLEGRVARIFELDDVPAILGLHWL
jgi:hypothetical protein